MRLLRLMFLWSLVFVAFSPAARAQADTVTKATVVKMVKAGLNDEIISSTIRRSTTAFDVSPTALLELKDQGISNQVILLMIDLNDAKRSQSDDQPSLGHSGSGVYQTDQPPTPPTPRQLVLSAKTIALEKSSAHPSRQALEKELLKRPEWKSLGLTIHRYKDNADLYVEIGYVSMSWITHRYVYRIYDRRTGTVIAAGETTSWGSLAENLAKHIAKSLQSVAHS